MSAQLELSSLPVASPELQAAADFEQRLRLVMAAVSELLDTDGQSAPTTRTIAEHFAGEEISTPPGSPEFAEAERLLIVLRDRGALRMLTCEPGYFQREDDGPTVDRWIRTRAAAEASEAGS